MTNPPPISRRAAISGAAAMVTAAGCIPALAQSDALTALVSAAKAEGTVVVDGPPVDTVRQAFVEGFQGAYGIPVSYLSSGTGASGARVRAERAAGKYLLDVFVSGGDTPTMTFLPNGWLDKIEPVLVAPDVLDRRKWLDGHIWYEDDAHTILRVFRYVTPLLALNTKLVDRRALNGWRSLLDPKWQGKLLIKDPGTTGAGSSLAGFFYQSFGGDFVHKLYVEQKPVFSRDPRQAVQWLAQGTYPVLIGPDPNEMDRFKRLGYPVAVTFPTDAPSVLSGGWGLISLLNKAPHPNAAKLFINWLAGRAGVEAFANATLSASLRTDVTYRNVPDFVFPQKNVKYMDAYDFKYVTEQRELSAAKARELIGE